MANARCLSRNFDILLEIPVELRIGVASSRLAAMIQAVTRANKPAEPTPKVTSCVVASALALDDATAAVPDRDVGGWNESKCKMTGIATPNSRRSSAAPSRAREMPPSQAWVRSLALVSNQANPTTTEHIAVAMIANHRPSGIVNFAAATQDVEQPVQRLGHALP